MRLPKNITGIVNSELEIKQMDGSLFQKLGYEIARKIYGKVLQCIPPQYPLNYYRIVIEKNKEIVSILLHEYFPYCAIASYKDELQISFQDNEEIEIELSPYYSVLKATFLNAPFHSEEHDLSEVELKNIKYWRPRTNGEVIYNCWD